MAKKDTCPGCQSFCMLGGQLANGNSVTGTDKAGKTYTHSKSQSYPDTWKQWEHVVPYDSSNPLNSIIQTQDTLSAKSQNDLITYIQSTWNEGTVNVASIASSIAQWKADHPNGIKGATPASVNNLVLYENTGVSGAEACSGEVIYDFHYNRLCDVLSESGNGVTSDLNGDTVSGNPSEGPVAGSASNRYDQNKVVEKEDLIKAVQYTTLYERASSLMYHPYQCNYCNIYEGGGNFGEIVRELGGAIMSKGPIYSWNKNTSIPDTIAGISGISFRQDCSGFVGACVSVFAAANGYSSGFSAAQCASGEYMSSSGLDQYGAADAFTRDISGDNGVIYADTEHVEASDDNGLIWSGGGGTDGSCYNGQQNGCHEHPIMMGYGCGEKPAQWQCIE